MGEAFSSSMADIWKGVGSGVGARTGTTQAGGWLGKLPTQTSIFDPELGKMMTVNTPPSNWAKFGEILGENVGKERGGSVERPQLKMAQAESVRRAEGRPMRWRELVEKLEAMAKRGW